MKNIIEIKNLSFQYEKNTPVLDQLSLCIEENTMNAILGANGSGKSTLLDCLVGVNKGYSGEIVIDKRLLETYTYRDFAKQVAYISQSTVINIDYSVRDFILFGRTPYLNIGQSLSKEDYEKCETHAKMLGIEYLLNKSITKISGGERQLCYICRALVQESKILIFDEPLSALDFGNQNKLLRIFSELIRSGKTIIFTTHNPNQVLDLNCNVIVMNEKHIVSIGKASEVITEDLLKKVYKDEVDVAKKHYTLKQ